MRASFYEGAGRFRIGPAEVPKAGRDEALLRVRRVGICGTDLHIFQGHLDHRVPRGGTIGHGYLTLSLAATLSIEAGIIPADAAAALNYGLDKVRFLTPVRAGARIRNRVVLTSAETKPQGRVLIALQNSIEIEGETKLALIAESLVMLIGAAS